MNAKIRFVLAGLGLLLFRQPVLATPVKIPVGSDNENVYAHSTKIPLDQAIAVALKKVPGRVSWAGMENFDGKLHSMVQVIQEDRSGKVVTLDAGSGAVEKVEDVKEKKKKEKEEKGDGAKKMPSVEVGKGSLPVGASKAKDWPYLAKITLEQAMQTALKAHPGKYVEVYLFDKSAFLFYGIEISGADKQIIKVDVDAGDGTVSGTEKM